MVGNILENIKVTNYSEMDACGRILLNTCEQNFFNAVAYLSVQVTEIFPSAQI